MNEYRSASKSMHRTVKKKKSFLDRVDFYLRQILSENLVNQFWRLYYSRLRRMLTISSGAIIMALCMQNQALSQIFDNVETGNLDEFLPDGSSADFFVELIQLFLFAGGITGIVGAVFQFIKGGNAEIWLGIAVAFIGALIAALFWTNSIYGG